MKNVEMNTIDRHEPCRRCMTDRCHAVPPHSIEEQGPAPAPRRDRYGLRWSQRYGAGAWAINERIFATIEAREAFAQTLTGRLFAHKSTFVEFIA